MKHIFFLCSLFFICTNCYPQVAQQPQAVNWKLAGNKLTAKTAAVNINFLHAGATADGSQPNDKLLKRILDSLKRDTAVIFFPNGIYLFTEPVKIASNITFRGQSANDAVLLFDLVKEDHSIKIEGSLTKTQTAVIKDIYKDSTQLEVADASLFSSGDYIKITEDDEALITSAWAKGYTGQLVQIEKITGNIIRLASPVRRNFHISKGPKIVKVNVVQNVGLESLKIERKDKTVSQASNIIFKYAANSYVKCIESYNCNFAHVELNGSTNISVTGCYLHHALDYGNGGKGYGVLVHLTSGECLIMNNTFNTLRHSVLLQAGANGNVIAYNYSVNPTWTGVMLPSNSAGDIVLHGNYSYANLFEGNVVQNIVIDNSHGKNGPGNTFFRNRAELYGIVMNNNAGNEQVFIGNEITGKGMLLGNYTLTGTNNYEYANNRGGSLLPKAVTALNDASLFLDEALAYYKAKSAWPPIGFPNKLNNHIIEAQEMFGKGVYTSCAADPQVKPADTTVVKDTVITKDTVVIIKDSTITGGDTTSIKDSAGTSVYGIKKVQQPVQIYPNPAREYLQIALQQTTAQRIKNVSIVSVTGQVARANFTGSLVDVRSLQDGMYFIRITFTDNSVFIQKFLKQGS